MSKARLRMSLAAIVVATGAQGADASCGAPRKMAAEAAFECGLSMHLAEGEGRDGAIAAEWFRQAAEQDYPPAQNNLGQMYLAGDGVQASDAEGFRWLERAAETRYPKAMYSLGFLYEFGRGGAQDHAKAAQWYTRAAEAGHAQAHNNLANLFLYGIGVPKDAELARDLYERAAAQANAQAAFNLGWIEDQGIGAPRNRKNAYGWFFVARSLGDPSLKLHALEALYRLEREMSDDELEAAETWLRAWRPARP